MRNRQKRLGGDRERNRREDKRGGAGGEEGPGTSSAAAGAVGLVPQQAGGLAPSPRSESVFPPQHTSLPFLLILFPPSSIAPTQLQLKPALSWVPLEWMIIPEGGTGQREKALLTNVGNNPFLFSGGPFQSHPGMRVLGSDGEKE